jgi:hypothetical protein
MEKQVLELWRAKGGSKMSDNNDEEKSEFKVVDRRHSATSETPSPAATPKTPAPESQAGQGFVMKDSETPAGYPDSIDFSTFIYSLATGALIHLGLAPDSATNKVQKNLELAKQNIEILAILKDKTKGNLTTQEQTLMDSFLTEVRLRFVEVSGKK